MSAAHIDLEHLRTWVGRVRADRDVASLRQAQLMAATLDRAAPALCEGDALPPLWHWIYFLEGLPPGELGRDGHPARGGFLPPVPLANRMWAGGRVAFEAAMAVGAAIEKRSRVLSVESKQGRSGPLVFVTVEHEVSANGRLAVREEHDLVFRDPGPASAKGEVAPAGQFHRAVEPNATLLFRYSALTFNGHRIHYDLDYCRNVEGYANLVIHGPLNATWLAGYAEEVTGARLRRFEYRGVRPAILGAALTLNANVDGKRVELWTAADGRVSMRASAEMA